LIEADFASEYKIRLAHVRKSMSWREFQALTEGLMFSDTRLARRFNKQKGGAES